jgi:hypothetical protein
VFTDDDEGNGVVLGDGAITADQLEDARRAVLACPERAIVIEDERRQQAPRSDATAPWLHVNTCVR